MPAAGTAVKVTLVPGHTVVAGVLIDTDGNTPLTVRFTRLLVAGLLAVQAELTSSSCTEVLDVRTAVVKEGEFVPVILPSTDQRYIGEEPAFKANDVKLAVIPAHKAVAGVVMETEGTTSASACNM